VVSQKPGVTDMVAILAAIVIFLNFQVFEASKLAFWTPENTILRYQALKYSDLFTIPHLDEPVAILVAFLIMFILWSQKWVP